MKRIIILIILINSYIYGNIVGGTSDMFTSKNHELNSIEEYDKWFTDKYWEEYGNILGSAIDKKSFELGIIYTKLKIKNKVNSLVNTSLVTYKYNLKSEIIIYERCIPQIKNINTGFHLTFDKEYCTKRLRTSAHKDFIIKYMNRLKPTIYNTWNGSLNDKYKSMIPKKEKD